MTIIHIYIYIYIYYIVTWILQIGIKKYKNYFKWICKVAGKYLVANNHAKAKNVTFLANPNIMQGEWVVI